MTDQSVPSSAGPRDHIAVIDGLRGLAIFGVIFHHLFALAVLFRLAGIGLRWVGVDLAFLIANGWLGVNLFFILSGLVLYLPYAQGRRRFESRADWIWFYKHRALRLLPLYYLAVLTQIALMGHLPFENLQVTQETIGLLTLTFPFMPGHFSPAMNWALWSIGVEVWFSAIFPLICLLCRRLGVRTVLLISLPIGLAVQLVGHRGDTTFTPTWIGDALMVGRLYEFLLGMWCAHLYARCALSTQRFPFLAAAAVALAVALPMLVGFPPEKESHIPFAPREMLADLGFFCLVAGLLAGRGQILAAALCVRPLRVMGMACYSLYIWHLPILGQLGLHTDTFNLPNLTFFVVSLVGISALTYRFVEFRKAPDWRSLFLIGAAHAKPPATNTAGAIAD